MEMCEDYKLQFIQEQESDVKLIQIDALQKIEVVQEEIKRHLCELDPQQDK